MMIKEKFILLCNKMFVLSKLFCIYMFVFVFMWVFLIIIMEVFVLIFIIVLFNIFCVLGYRLYVF